MKLGSHVSNNGLTMLAGSVEEALNYDANCFMVYLGAPQNTFRKKASELNIDQMHHLMAQNNLKIEDVIIHAPYIVNLAQSDDEKWQFGIDFITSEVKLTAAIGAKYIVIHPGAHVGMGTDYGLKRIACAVNQIIKNTINLNVTILLETMSGKGTECGRNFEEIKTIIDMIDDKSKIGVCLDTCHIHDAGYDIVNDYEQVWEQFNQIIGFNYLKVIHLNDSKNIRGAQKDRHENIGFGHIGFDTLHKIVVDSRFHDIPKILETPYIGENGGVAPYQAEIAMLKKSVFDPNLKDNFQKTA